MAVKRRINHCAIGGITMRKKRQAHNRAHRRPIRVQKLQIRTPVHYYRYYRTFQRGYALHWAEKEHDQPVQVKVPNGYIFVIRSVVPAKLRAQMTSGHLYIYSTPSIVSHRSGFSPVNKAPETAPVPVYFKAARCSVREPYPETSFMVPFAQTLLVKEKSFDKTILHQMSVTRRGIRTFQTHVQCHLTCHVTGIDKRFVSPVRESIFPAGKPQIQYPPG